MQKIKEDLKALLETSTTANTVDIQEIKTKIDSVINTNSVATQQIKEEIKNISTNSEEVKQILDKLDSITQKLTNTDSSGENSDETLKNQNKILSFLNTKKIDMKDILGLNTNVETTIQHPVITAYTNLKMCYENKFRDYNPSAPQCNIYSIRNRGEIDKKLDNISKLIPVCSSYYQSKKFNGAEKPANEQPMSEACEQHLALYAKKCTDHQFCNECRNTAIDAPVGCIKCKYINKSQDAKFYLQPYCEKLLEEIKDPYMNRQFLYSFSQIDLCQTESCKAYYMQENANYRPTIDDGTQVCSNIDFSSKDLLKSTIALETKCKNKLEELRSQYEDECNTFIEGAYNKKNYCTYVLDQIL